MKKSLLIFIATILVLSLVIIATGCGGQDQQQDQDNQQNDQTQSDQQNAEQVEIVWWQYPRYAVEGKEHGEFENEIIADFEAENPDIKVKIEHIPWNGGPEKVNMAITSNSTPDLLFDYPGRIIGYARQGVLVPLDDILTDDIKSEIPENLLKDCQYDGKTYMYPSSAAVIAAGVNVDFFKEIGKEDLLPLDRENRAWSLEEFEAALNAVKDSGKDVYPSMIYAGNEQGDSSMRMFLQSAFDCDVVNEDGTQVVMNSENAVKGLEWMIDKYEEGLFAPGAETAVSLDSIETFFQGQVAINLIAAPSHYPLHQTYIDDGKAEEFEWKIVPYPNAQGKDPKVEAQLTGYCVFDNGDEAKAEAAKKLVKFILDGDKYKEESVKATGQLPIRSSMADLYDDPEMKFLQNLLDYAANTGYTVNNYAGLRTKWYPNIQGALTGKLTAQQALDAFAQEGTEEINKK